MKSLCVNLKRKTDESYSVCFTKSYFRDLILEIKRNEWGSKYAIITDSKVKKLYGEELQNKLKRANINSEIFSFNSGEKYKTLKQAEKLTRSLFASGFGRDDAIIALGGGVTGDMAGFVASIYMRGIPYIQIPTTLLSMIDASIGGKTGTDTGFGKNLIGTFYQPKSVYIDLSFLETLPEKQFKNGVAEIIKYGVVASPGLLKLLDKKHEKILNLEDKILNKIIKKCVKIKISIVQQDEKESNIRKFLNYGHTLGHAIEKITNFKIQHGEAVSIGMSIVNTMAVNKNLMSRKDRDYINKIIEKYKLPNKLPKRINIDKIAEAIKYDKKAKGGKPMFVIAKKIGNITLSDKITKKDIVKACKKHL